MNTKLTDKLQQILDSGTSTELTAHNLVELQHLEESTDLGENPEMRMGLNSRL